MESRAKLLGHPIHPMLIVFPLGLLATSVIVDIVYFAGNALIVVMLLFFASALMRSDLPSEPPLAAYLGSFAGAGLALVTAWLGGELVDRLGVGVSDNAHLDAPSSLRQTPTSR